MNILDTVGGPIFDDIVELAAEHVWATKNFRSSTLTITRKPPVGFQGGDPDWPCAKTPLDTSICCANVILEK